MPNVYVPHVPTRLNTVTQVRDVSHDISPARAYGDLVILLDSPYYVHVADMPDVLELLQSRLMQVRRNDFIVAIGDPVLFALAVSVAIAKNGTANTLRWDRYKRVYNKIEVSV